MCKPQEVPHSDWRQAIDQALGDPRAASRGLLVFYETRGDLAVEVSSRTGPSSVRTLQTGISAVARAGDSPEDRWVHLSDPAFEDVGRVARSALDPTVRFPASAAGSTVTTPVTGGSEAAATDWIGRIHREILRLAPTAQAHSRWVQFDQRVLVGRAELGIVADRRRGCRIRVQAWIEGARPSTAVCEAVLKPRDAATEVLAGPRPEDTAGRLVERLRRRVHARKPPGGCREVVLGPGIGGVLAHEIVGHALEADTAQRGSWLTRSDPRVASSELTILDDPRRGRAPWRVDDEGCPSGVTPLVSAGRVRSWLCDRATAGRTGRQPTGHGRRASYREPVRPRMGCTFIAAGRLDPEEVSLGVDGIYVRRMEAATVDAESGRATFRVTDGDLLTGGRFEAALLPHLLSVDARETLIAVDRIANDLAFDTCVGSCQRDGQSLAVSVGAPTISLGLATVIA